MIHLIEDETNMRELLDISFVDPTHLVVEAHSPQQALSYLDEEEPELMILNLDRSGFEILDHMDEILPEYVNFPIVLLSTMELDHSAILKQYPRVVKIFTQPLDVHELLAFVHKALGRP